VASLTKILSANTDTWPGRILQGGNGVIEDGRDQTVEGADNLLAVSVNYFVKNDVRNCATTIMTHQKNKLIMLFLFSNAIKDS
jgi:hypothetical protein